MPYQDNLQSLMNEEEYRQLVGADLWRRMDYIRRCGNNVAHGNKKLGRDEAMLCLENLFIFLDYIAHCYTENSTERTFDKNTITARMEKARESKVAAKNIREELEKGNMEKVNDLLGYPYFTRGEIVYGRQLGRTIGIPTANLIPPKVKKLPPNGVYITQSLIGNRVYQGITNVGYKPTVKENFLGVETYLFALSLIHI